MDFPWGSEAGLVRVDHIQGELGFLGDCELDDKSGPASFGGDREEPGAARNSLRIALELFLYGHKWERGRAGQVTRSDRPCLALHTLA